MMSKSYIIGSTEDIIKLQTYISAYIQLLCKLLISFINSTDKLIVQIPVLLKHVSQEPMSLYSICPVPVPIDTYSI